TRDDQALNELEDWYPFICQNTLFRRASEDAYAALQNPVEAVFFIYRGMEWLLRAGNIGWKELAEDIGISFNDIKKFKQSANSDLGQRHGIVSGLKLRATVEEYGSLFADFLYGICKVRKRVDSSYKVISEQRAGQIALNSMPIVPYP
ncbi:hypothetical protein AMJ80_03495, partial [bacterium SM23_31]